MTRDNGWEGEPYDRDKVKIQKYANSYKFFQNRACQFFPCHDNIDEREFNCLFCYCPVYFVACPGTYRRLDDGRKDCMGCSLNHEPRFWEMVQSMMKNPKADSFPVRGTEQEEKISLTDYKTYNQEYYD